MKKAFLFAFVFTTAACLAQASYDLGQRLGDASFVNIPKQRCLTAPDTIEPCVKVRTRGVVYTIGYRSKGRIISYLETHDPSFVTADGLRVGSRLAGATGTLAWVNAFGEIVGRDTGDGWEPIVSRDRMLRCENGTETELNGLDSQNRGPCEVKILGFKKRTSPQIQAKNRLNTRLDPGR